MSNYGSLYALSTAIMFATFGVVAKYIYTYNLTSNMVFLVSSLFSVLILFGVLLRRHGNFKFMRIDARNFKLSFLGAGVVGLFLPNVFVLTALQHIGVGVQKAITYSNPLFTILVYRFLYGKRLSRNEALGVALMVLGLVLVVGNATASGSHLFYGVLFSLLAAFFSSLNSMLTETSRTTLDVVLYWFYSFLGATVFSLTVMLVTRESTNIFPLFSSPRLIFLLFLCALMNFVLPYLTFFKAVTTIGAVRTGIIMTTAPALTAVFGVVFFGERITLLQIFGIAMIIGASLVSSLKPKMTPPEGLKVGI
ncbi:MAG: DMT family transporter [Rickettsiales bacterium]|jgi:drug/metabolite transporter (DMT)-like permease|nr:DMT family transporter [Rickettsiales bacterium]